MSSREVQQIVRGMPTGKGLHFGVRCTCGATELEPITPELAKLEPAAILRSLPLERAQAIAKFVRDHERWHHRPTVLVCELSPRPIA